MKQLIPLLRGILILIYPKNMESEREIKNEIPLGSDPEKNKDKSRKCCHFRLMGVVISCVILSSIFGTFAGFLSYKMAKDRFGGENYYAGNAPAAALPDGKTKVVKEESAIIDAVKMVSPAVVSIIITEDLPKVERYYSDRFGSDLFNGTPFEFNVPQQRQNGTEKQVTGKGSGFVISNDGYIVTNKHVVSNEKAEYTVLMNDGKKYDARVVAQDPVNDIAVIKIDAKDLQTVEFGDSGSIEIGQVAIAIGNALGEYKNTVSVGVISGLDRSIVAGSEATGDLEQLKGLIQTDAAINPGNSGGPLLNSSGQVVGMNTAIATNAEGIGFAIPVKEIKKVANDVMTEGRIIRPYIGIRYMQITKDLAAKNNISYDYGALIVRGGNKEDLAVIPASPGDKAGLVENDIILEVDGVKLDENNSLTDIVAGHNVGDEITLRISHRGEESTVKVKLEERKQ